AFPRSGHGLEPDRDGAPPHLPAAPRAETPPHRAHAGAVPLAAPALGRALLRRLPRRSHLSGPAALPRRSPPAVDPLRAHRPGADDDDQRARSGARPAALPHLRAGRRRRSPPAGGGEPDGSRALAPAPPHLRAAARRGGA